MTKSFIDTLACTAPDPARAQGLDLYAFLVGSWVFDARVHLADGTLHTGQGSIAAGWVLAGRALQDVWILPGIFHGTTLRVYDPARAAWHILWSDPLHQYYSRQLGQADGEDIVQLGHDDGGRTTRWSFRERRPADFTWRGEVSEDGGASWRLEAEFQCRRA